MKNISTLTSLPEIIQCKSDFQKQFEKIDKLELVVNAVNHDLTNLEQSVNKAEEELGYNNSGIKGFLKPWFGMSTKMDKTKSEESIANIPVYQSPLTFKSSEYFGSQEPMDASLE